MMMFRAARPLLSLRHIFLVFLSFLLEAASFQHTYPIDGGVVEYVHVINEWGGGGRWEGEEREKMKRYFRIPSTHSLTDLKLLPLSSKLLKCSETLPSIQEKNCYV